MSPWFVFGVWGGTGTGTGTGTGLLRTGQITQHGITTGQIVSHGIAAGKVSG